MKNKKATKSKAGRPRMDPKQVKAVLLSLRMDPLLRERVKESAQREGNYKPSEWLRQIIIHAVVKSELKAIRR